MGEDRMTTGLPPPKFLPYTPLNTARFSPKYLYGLFGSEIVCLAFVLACLVTTPRPKFYDNARQFNIYQPVDNCGIKYFVTGHVK